ncbi:hypothetical protein AB3R30_11595 [Leptolyngbyaceae cyanobacterium UHCC 1019]
MMRCLMGLTRSPESRIAASISLGSDESTPCHLACSALSTLSAPAGARTQKMSGDRPGSSKLGMRNKNCLYRAG